MIDRRRKLKVVPRAAVDFVRQLKIIGLRDILLTYQPFAKDNNFLKTILEKLNTQTILKVN